VVLVDVRTGRVGFRTIARGDGDDPWSALTRRGEDSHAGAAVIREATLIAATESGQRSHK